MAKKTRGKPTAQRRAYDAGKLRPKNKSNAKRSSALRSRKPRGTEPATDAVFEGAQRMVPGVPPLAPLPTSAGGGRMTVQTVRLSVDECSAHRVQAAKEGERHWGTWALRVLNQRAGVAGLSGGRS